MTEGFLEERGIAYRTNDFRDGRPTLVFVHGISGSASAWIHFEEKLKDDYNIVTYDLRGQGISKKYPRYSDYDFKQFAEDLSHLLLHLKISSCSLVAHSFGTVIALETMIAGAPVTSAVLLSTNYKINTMPSIRASLPFLMLATWLLRLLPFSPHTGSRLNYRNFGYSPDWSFKRMYPEIKDVTLRIYLYCLQHMYQYRTSSWSNLAVPTLLIHGRVDSFVPVAHSILAHKEIPHSQLKIIEGANHMLVLNNVPELIEAIKGFIK